MHKYVDDLFLSYPFLDIAEKHRSLAVYSAGITAADVPVVVVIAIFGNTGFQRFHDALVVLVAHRIARTARESDNAAVNAGGFLDIIVYLVQVGVITLLTLIDLAVIVCIAVKGYGVPAVDNRLILLRHSLVVDHKEGRLDIVLIQNVKNLHCVDGGTVVKCEISHFAVVLFRCAGVFFTLYVRKSGYDPHPSRRERCCLKKCSSPAEKKPKPAIPPTPKCWKTLRRSMKSSR